LRRMPHQKQQWRSLRESASSWADRRRFMSQQDLWLDWRKSKGIHTENRRSGAGAEASAVGRSNWAVNRSPAGAVDKKRRVEKRILKAYSKKTTCLTCIECQALEDNFKTQQVAKTVFYSSLSQKRGEDNKEEERNVYICDRCHFLEAKRTRSSDYSGVKPIN
jgi:hypothetical protein